MNQPYPQQPHPPQGPPPQWQPPPPPPLRTPRWAVAALVVGVLNLLLTLYLVIVVIRAQIALSELGQLFQGGLPGGLGGFGG